VPSRMSRRPGFRAEDRRETVERLRPYVERAARFSGWAFRGVAVTPFGAGPPWDYERRATHLLRTARTVLDLGTGGGEAFGDLCRGFGGRAVASEEWEVNAPVAARRLGALGVDVVRCRSLRLPFRDASFELVLDRHEDLDPSEVARVLAPGGRVLTQQVGRSDWTELRRFFPRMRDFGSLLEEYQKGFREAGLVITEAATHDRPVAYQTLEDLVFMLCVAPWSIPGFSPLDRDLDGLLELESALLTKDGIVLTESRFLVEAEKPGQPLAIRTSVPERSRLSP